VLSQDIRTDTPQPLFTLPIFSLCRMNVINTNFTDASLTRALSYRHLGDCVKTCSTVSTLPFSVELRDFHSVPCPHFALFRQPQNYHATMQLLHMLVVVFKIHFLNVFTPHSHYPFPAAFKNTFASLKC
jgi:hypothetical protein